MKQQSPNFHIWILLAIILVLAWVGSISAQDVSHIPWSLISAGGGKAMPVNSNFTISFTLGQPFAGRASNGNFTLTSGYFGLLLPPEIELLPFSWFLPLLMH